MLFGLIFPPPVGWCCFPHLCWVLLGLLLLLVMLPSPLSLQVVLPISSPSLGRCCFSLLFGGGGGACLHFPFVSCCVPPPHLGGVTVLPPFGWCCRSPLSGWCHRSPSPFGWCCRSPLILGGDSFPILLWGGAVSSSVLLDLLLLLLLWVVLFVDASPLRVVVLSLPSFFEVVLLLSLFRVGVVLSFLLLFGWWFLVPSAFCVVMPSSASFVWCCRSLFFFLFFDEITSNSIPV